MPIFTFACSRDGHAEEHIMSYDRSRKVEMICPHCGDAMIIPCTTPAYTPSAWNAGWTTGMDHALYSKALGRKVSSRREEEKILNDAGFVCETDLGKDWIENTANKKAEQMAQQDAKHDLYNTILAETGDEVKAVEAAFPAHECLDGTLDALYDESISI